MMLRVLIECCIREGREGDLIKLFHKLQTELPSEPKPRG